jgi:hypothetical protein
VVAEEEEEEPVELLREGRGELDIEMVVARSTAAS